MKDEIILILIEDDITMLKGKPYIKDYIVKCWMFYNGDDIHVYILV